MAATTKKKPAAKKKPAKKAPAKPKAAPVSKDSLLVLPLAVVFTALCILFAILATVKYY